jgi:hypothetical protein
MNQTTKHLPLCAAKGFYFSSIPNSDEEWSINKTNHNLPNTIEEILGLIDDIFYKDGVSTQTDIHKLTLAIQKPSLSSEELNRIDSLIASTIPDLPTVLETEHFTVFYDEKNPSIPEGYIEFASQYYEDVWELYKNKLDKIPYLGLADDNTKQKNTVAIYNAAKSYTGPNLPIVIDVSTLNRSPIEKYTTFPHELFHKIQYSCGYLTKLTNWPSEPWIIEGSATWAMMWVGKNVKNGVSAVINSTNLLNPFYAPDRPISSFSYDAVSFWVYLEGIQLTNGTFFMEAFWDAISQLQNFYIGISISSGSGYGSVGEGVLMDILSPKLITKSLQELYCSFGMNKFDNYWLQNGTSMMLSQGENRYPKVVNAGGEAVPNPSDNISYNMRHEVTINTPSAKGAFGVNNIDRYGSAFFRLDLTDVTRDNVFNFSVTAKDLQGVTIPSFIGVVMLKKEKISFTHVSLTNEFTMGSSAIDAVVVIITLGTTPFVHQDPTVELEYNLT